MSDKDCGGHAFPTIYPELAHTECGATLRDYFAAKAMQSLLLQVAKVGADAEVDNIAPASYQMADAMIEARKP